MDNNLEQILTVVGEQKKVKIGNKIYIISASPIGELTDLINRISEFDKVDVNDIGEILDKKTLKLMSEIIYMGLKKYNEGITCPTIFSFSKPTPKKYN